MNECWVNLIGVWIFSDSIYSLILYKNRDDQEFWRDHSIRIVRLILSAILVIFG